MPQRTPQTYGVWVMEALIKKRSTTVQKGVSVRCFFCCCAVSFNSTKLPHMLNEHSDSLVPRYFRDSWNEREPAQAAAGDHVSHQTDDREAYLGQTRQNGIRRRRFTTPNTWREPSWTRWEQTHSGSSKVTEDSSIRAVSLYVNYNYFKHSSHIFPCQDNFTIFPPDFRVSREAAMDINTEPSQSEQIVWDDPTAREERAKLADNLQWPGSPSQHSESLAPPPPPAAENVPSFRDSMTDSELVEMGKRSFIIIRVYWKW